MKKIKEYTVIVSNSDSIELSGLVNEKIKDGWQPYGDTLMTRFARFYQPMVKYESEQNVIFDNTR